VLFHKWHHLVESPPLQVQSETSQPLRAHLDPVNSGSKFEELIGYSRAVVDGQWIFVSGTTGFDYKTMSISDDLLEPTEQCLKNIVVTLQQADATLMDVIQVLYILPDASEFEDCWPLLQRSFGDVPPAATMISANLADPRIKIEIQVTARKQSAREAELPD
jgi:enamine deaminase RidA (YjgF/YER057c/UK114 family)